MVAFFALILTALAASAQAQNTTSADTSKCATTCAPYDKCTADGGQYRCCPVLDQSVECLTCRGVPGQGDNLKTACAEYASKVGAANATTSGDAGKGSGAPAGGAGVVTVVFAAVAGAGVALL